MNTQFLNTLVRKANTIIQHAKIRRDSKYRHVSFLVRNTKILSYGWNDTDKTHPKAKELGYFNCAIHSEMHSYLRALSMGQEIKGATLVNIQLRCGNKLGISRPCETCQKLISLLNLREIYYVNQQGEWENVRGDHTFLNSEKN